MSDASYKVSSKLAHWFVKEDPRGVFTICGHGSHFDFVTNIMLMNVHFIVQKAYIQNWVENGPTVSVK